MPAGSIRVARPTHARRSRFTGSDAADGLRCGGFCDAVRAADGARIRSRRPRLSGKDKNALDTRLLIVVMLSVGLIFAYQELVLKRLYPPNQNPQGQTSAKPAVS